MLRWNSCDLDDRRPLLREGDKADYRGTGEWKVTHMSSLMISYGIISFNLGAAQMKLCMIAFMLLDGIDKL